MSTNKSVPKIEDKEDANMVIRDLEKKTENIVKTIGVEGCMSNINVIMSSMNNGKKEFEKRTGREMTYAEMRAAWG